MRKDFVIVDTERIAQLMEQGRELKGDVLLLDIQNAEIFIQRTEEKRRALFLLQRVLRGRLGRLEAKRRFEALRRVKTLRVSYAVGRTECTMLDDKGDMEGAERKERER